MSAANNSRGLKRVCVECGSRFYDMNKRPIICPGCGAEFSLEAKVKARRGRVADPIVAEKEEIVEAPKDKDEAESVVDGDNVVSLDALDDGADSNADDNDEDSN